MTTDPNLIEALHTIKEAILPYALVVALILAGILLWHFVLILIKKGKE